ncbi:MAG: HWE histidine kinase domain-containing protein [Hyphomicrobiaceae bacterium]|nr:HWE histidine kinase domain-containing protein [Hyphomicrobiaceae bacterium]
MSHPPKRDVPGADSSSEARETVEAIHQGAVDALVVQGPNGPRVVMLEGDDEPYRVLVERMSDGALTLGPDNTILYVNSRLADLTGHSTAELVGRKFESLFAAPGPPGSETGEARLKRGAHPIPVSVWTSPIALGGISATLVTIADLSMQQRAKEVALAERFARSILEQATEAIVVLGPTGTITHTSNLAEHLAIGPPVGRGFSDVFPLEAQGASQSLALARFSHESLDAMLATKPFHGVEVRLLRHKRSFLLSAGPLLNDAREPIGAIVTLTDITERKRAEEQQAVLVAELNHRVKNILAVVQAVAGQTIRASPSLEAFKASFAGRIQALSIAHDVLTRTRWIGIGLMELLQAVLAPYRSDARITTEGPPTLLPARAVVPLSMVLHELATNASKYGALSTANGAVNVRWDLIQNGTPRVRIDWGEAGGPVVREGRKGGFGTTLIKRVIEHDLEGEVVLRLAPGGAQASLTFPLQAGIEMNDLRGAAARSR